MIYKAHESQNRQNRDRWSVLVRDLDGRTRWTWYTDYNEALEDFVWELEHSAFEHLELFHKGRAAFVYRNNRLDVDLNVF